MRVTQTSSRPDAGRSVLICLRITVPDVLLRKGGTNGLFQLGSSPSLGRSEEGQIVSRTSDTRGTKWFHPDFRTLVQPKTHVWGNEGKQEFSQLVHMCLVDLEKV